MGKYFITHDVLQTALSTISARYFNPEVLTEHRALFARFLLGVAELLHLLKDLGPLSRQDLRHAPLSLGAMSRLLQPSKPPPMPSGLRRAGEVALARSRRDNPQER
jgi:hypothetical protein